MASRRVLFFGSTFMVGMGVMAFCWAEEAPTKDRKMEYKTDRKMEYKTPVRRDEKSVARPSELMSPTPELTIDQLISRLEQLQTEEKALKEQLQKKLADQNQKLQRLGIVGSHPVWQTPQQQVPQPPQAPPPPGFSTPHGPLSN